MEWAQLHPNTNEMTHYEFEILETIQNNPDIHHNGLLKIVVPKFMAKKLLNLCFKFNMHYIIFQN